MTDPPPSPAERLASILRWLTQAVTAQTLGGPLGQRVIGLIVSRLTGTLNRFAALAATIAAGRYTPRAPAGDAPRQRRPGQGPPPQSLLHQKFGWLLPLVPYSGAFRAQLESLLQDAEMVALMAAAPVPMRRMVRPLCWMLGLPPPSALARRRTPRRPPSPDPPPDSAQADPAATSHPPPRRPRRAPLPCLAPPPPPPPSLTLEYSFGWPRLVWT